MTKEERLLLEWAINRALEDKNHSLSITLTKEGTTVSVHPCPTEDIPDPVVEGPYDKLEKMYDDAIKSVKACYTCKRSGTYRDPICNQCCDYDNWEADDDSVELKKEKPVPRCSTCKHGWDICSPIDPHCTNCVSYSNWEEADD